MIGTRYISDSLNNKFIIMQLISYLTCNYKVQILLISFNQNNWEMNKYDLEVFFLWFRLVIR